jgi:hypothetical protein
METPYLPWIHLFEIRLLSELALLCIHVVAKELVLAGSFRNPFEVPETDIKEHESTKAKPVSFSIPQVIDI